MTKQAFTPEQKKQIKFVDENNRIESLKTHVLNNLPEQTEQKNYLITTSFNRNGFVFEN